MAVTEQEMEKSRMSNSKVLNFLFVLEACFQKSCKDVFQKLVFVLANYIPHGCSQGCFSKTGNSSLQIIHQLESDSISFLLGQRNGFEPDQLFSLTACLHTFVYNQYKKWLFNCWVNHKWQMSPLGYPTEILSNSPFTNWPVKKFRWPPCWLAQMYTDLNTDNKFDPQERAPLELYYTRHKLRNAWHKLRIFNLIAIS
jgi:hypothetical protein